MPQPRPCTGCANFSRRGWLAVELHRGRRATPRGSPPAAARWPALRPAAVAAGDVHMHARGRALQDVLTAVRHGCTIDQAGWRLYPNAERRLRSLEHELERCIRRRCSMRASPSPSAASFSLTQLRYEYPPELVPDGLTASEHLRALTEAGIARRWPQGVPAAVRALIERELALIAELRYEHFFLTVHDVVASRASENILCQGRGSAANSAVCYALGITEIDPARMQLLFERFISRERASRPTSTSTSSTSGARRSSSTSTASTAANAPRWRHGDLLPLAQRDARCRQGARLSPSRSTADAAARMVGCSGRDPARTICRRAASIPARLCG
jgi:DNA polymerase III alpha subunit